MAIPGGVSGIMGNIGAGKSTLADFIQSEKGNEILRKHIPEGIPIKVIHEPTDQYARRAFYSNMERYTDRFEISQAQLRILRHIFANQFYQDPITREETPGVVIFDRTLIEGYSIFGINSFEDGFLTHSGKKEYNELIKHACDELGRNFPRECKWLESLLFYLEVKDPEILKLRQTERDKIDEKDGDIELDYLKKINRRYENFATDPKKHYKRFGLSEPKVIKLDGSRNIMEDPTHLEECTEIIGKNIWEMVQACSLFVGENHDNK